MKSSACLKSNDIVFYLLPKITLIGRVSCDIIIENNTVDCQHALIEYYEPENCFLLKDLNSIHGTSVNEFILQNACIRLNDGDLIKFGLSDGRYEFHSSNLINQKDTEITELTKIPVSQMQYRQSPPHSNLSLPIISKEGQPVIQQKPAIPGSGPWVQFPRAQLSNSRNLRPKSSNHSYRPPIVTGEKAQSYNLSSHLLKSSFRQITPDGGSQLLNEFLDSMNRQRSEMDHLKKNSEISESRDELKNEYFHRLGELETLRDLVERLLEQMNGTEKSQDKLNIGMLRQGLEKCQKDLKISNDLVTTLQKDLRNRDDAIMKLKKDIDKLNEDISEKNVSISSLMSKFARLKDSQSEIQNVKIEKEQMEEEVILLKKQLKEKETQKVQLTETVSELKKSEELNAKMVKDLNVQFVKGKDESKRLESELNRKNKEIMNQYERFRSNVVMITSLNQTVQLNANSIEDDELVQLLKTHFKSKVENEVQIREKLKTTEENLHNLNLAMENLNLFAVKLKESFRSFHPGERTSNKIRDVLDCVKTFSFSENIWYLKDILIENFESELEFQLNLEGLVSRVLFDVDVLSVSECVSIMISKYNEANTCKTAAESKLEKILDLHLKEKEELKTKYEEIYLSDVSKAVENERLKNGIEFRHSLDEAIKVEESKIEKLSQDFGSRIRDYEQTIGSLEQEKDSQWKDSLNALSQKDGIINRLERSMEEMIESQNELNRTMNEQIKATKEKLECEIEGYKEEISQKVVCIDSLKDRLVKANNENKVLNNHLTKFRCEAKKNNKNINSTESNSLTSNDVIGQNVAILNLDRTLTNLRHENILLKGKGKSDKGNVEHQGEDINALLMKIKSLEEELNNITTKLSKQSTLFNELSKELDSMKIENRKYYEQLVEEKLKCDTKDKTIKDLISEKDKILLSVSGIEQDGRISTELASLGSQCRGERHTQIIESQKIALSQLRQKMKAMEMRSSGFTDQDVNHQTIQFKKEIAELQAKLAMIESAHQGSNSLSDILSQRNVARKTLQITSQQATVKGDGQINPANPNNEHEKVLKQLKFDLDLSKTAHFDVQESFELSENSYFEILRQLMLVLDIENVNGQQTFANLPRDAKEDLKCERAAHCQLIIQKITILKQMLKRKDELLQSYEKDLVKLKQAEDLASKTQAQVEHFILQTRSKGDEIDLLRETLNRTKDILNQERRLNIAIKHNMVYVPDNGVTMPMMNPASPKCHCPPEDLTDKGKEIERKKTEKLKRKDYEIKTLKSELCHKDKQLTKATNRLYRLETSMGIVSEEPVI